MPGSQHRSCFTRPRDRERLDLTTEITERTEERRLELSKLNDRWVDVNSPISYSPEIGNSHYVHSLVTRNVISAAIEVHRELGPGLLESAYQACRCRELALRGIPFRTEVPLPIDYKGVRLDCCYRMDLVVDDKVAIEIKSIDKILPIHEAQLLTYLRLSQLRVGLLMNFNVRMLRQGIIRRIL